MPRHCETEMCRNTGDPPGAGRCPSPPVLECAERRRSERPRSAVPGALSRSRRDVRFARPMPLTLRAVRASGKCRVARTSAADNAREWHGSRTSRLLHFSPIIAIDNSGTPTAPASSFGAVGLNDCVAGVLAIATREHMALPGCPGGSATAGPGRWVADAPGTRRHLEARSRPVGRPLLTTRGDARGLAFRRPALGGGRDDGRPSGGSGGARRTVRRCSTISPSAGAPPSGAP